MNTPRQLQDLLAEIVHIYPSAALEWDPLPSGVCFLWLTVGERNFVLEYHPTQGTGVSENLPDTPPFVGHDHCFADLDEAVDFLKKMLADAAQSAPAKTAPAFAGGRNFPFEN